MWHLFWTINHPTYVFVFMSFPLKPGVGHGLSGKLSSMQQRSVWDRSTPKIDVKHTWTFFWSGPSRRSLSGGLGRNQPGHPDRKVLVHDIDISETTTQIFNLNKMIVLRFTCLYLRNTRISCKTVRLLDIFGGVFVLKGKSNMWTNYCTQTSSIRNQLKKTYRLI